MKILYATDGLAPAQTAGRLLERIADPHRVEIEVLTVFETAVRSALGFPEILLDQVPQRARWATRTAEDAAQKLLRGDYKVETITAEGDPSEEIIRTIEDHGSDLTILGGGRGGWLGNILLGSVSLHVLHNSPTSMLIAHEKEDARGTARILLGTDGSRGAELAQQVLMNFADPARCVVRVVGVAQTTPAVAPDIPGAILPPSVAGDAEVTRQLVQHAERYTEEAAATLRSAGFRTEACVRDGHPAGRLLEEAQRWKAELVVVGSRGLGAIGRALLGSVSDRIVRQAPATLISRRSEHNISGKKDEERR